MCMYIGIEDLVANAIIELGERNKKTEVLYKNLDKYGATVLKILNKEGEKAILLLSTERTNEFLSDYIDYFEAFANNGGEKGIRLKTNVNTNMLWTKFRGYLSMKALKAFMDPLSIQALGV